MPMNADPAAESRVPVDGLLPYSSAREHLSELLERHAELCRRFIARGKTRKPNDALGFVAISEEEVRQLLQTEKRVASDSAQTELDEIDRSIAKWNARIDARQQLSRLKGVRLPMAELADRFTLTPREVDLLFASLAVELDRRIERVYGFLNDDMSRRLVSTGIALGLYCDGLADEMSARSALNPHARLRHYRLLEMNEETGSTPWLSRSLRIDERIAAFLTGDDSIDGRLVRYMAPLDASGPVREETSKSIAHWIRALHAGQKPLTYLQGARHSAPDALVYAISRVIGVDVLAVDMDAMPDTIAEFESTLFLLFREGLLSRSAIYLRNLDRALEPPQGAVRHRVLLRLMADMGSIVFASGDTAWSFELPGEPVSLRIVELKPPSVDEQLQAWRVASHRQFSDAEFHRLISLHPLPVAAIRDVWRVAKSAASGNDDGKSQPTLPQLQQACRARAGAPVSSMARRLEPKHAWSDLVLPVPQFEQLQAICAQARHSSVVFGTWCFDRKMSLGRGLNALFSGPPGTGKTMAAEVIAQELGIEILKIDLSQVVSKYIGETEKNLRQLFDQAAHANAILFFDEADALLGKRSAVKDAHDRYANTETAYLLQKMEEYPGITILSTNLRQNMDEAFTRRMRFIVDFPFPEEVDRLRIWRTVWPKEVPFTSDVDLPTLARQFRLSGGAIRNVALSAAFLAADHDGQVSMQHLLRATKRELQKMGRLINDDELKLQAERAS